MTEILTPDDGDVERARLRRLRNTEFKPRSRRAHKNITPLADLPDSVQAKIAEAVAQETPPSRWQKFGAPGDPRPLAMMESRAWYEWHWARGKDPGSSRRLDPILRASVIERDGLVCGICFGEVEANDVHIDHIYPVALGGKDVMDNLRVTHSLCNMRKGAKIDGP